MKKHGMGRILSLLLAVAMCFSLAACGDGSSTDNNEPNSSNSSSGEYIQAGAQPIVDSLSYALRNASWDLSPWKNNGSSAGAMWLLLNSNLMANPGFGTALEDMQYDMAESVTFSEDNKTATIKLRDYIHDSKGNQITAEDVVFSYETAPNTGVLYAKIASLLDTITALDEYTVQMTVADVVPGTWEMLLADCPIVSKSWYENASEEERSLAPASTGAYEIVENIPGTSVTMKAVEDFWQKDDLRTIYQTVNAQTLNFVAIPEESMRVIAFENGEVDAAYLDSTNFPMFADDPNYSIFSSLMSQPNILALNCSEQSVLGSNPALRKAIFHAIDVDQVALAIAGEYYVRDNELGHSLCSDFDPAWNEEPYYEYDLDLARQYMAEAGYDPENSGLTLRYMVRNVAANSAGAVVLQNCLSKIGIDLDILTYDQALFDTYSNDPTQWDIINYSLTMSSGTVTEEWKSYLGVKSELGTAGFVQDDKLQSLLDEAMSKHDSASMNAFREYARDQAYCLPLFTTIGYQFAQSYLTDAVFNFMGGLQLNSASVSSDLVNG